MDSILNLSFLIVVGAFFCKFDLLLTYY